MIVLTKNNTYAKIMLRSEFSIPTVHEHRPDTGSPIRGEIMLSKAVRFYFVNFIANMVGIGVIIQPNLTAWHRYEQQLEVFRAYVQGVKTAYVHLGYGINWPLLGGPTAPSEWSGIFTGIAIVFPAGWGVYCLFKALTTWSDERIAEAVAQAPAQKNL